MFYFFLEKRHALDFINKAIRQTTETNILKLCFINKVAYRPATTGQKGRNIPPILMDVELCFISLLVL